jgi:hypothetical protein
METHIHDEELLDQGNPPMGHHSRADATFVLRSLSNGRRYFRIRAAALEAPQPDRYYSPIETNALGSSSRPCRYYFRIGPGGCWDYTHQE